ncbi:hypothetical protein Salat_0763700 [Sesamum alatum]|uniref:Uncharacterized protein n=1 Tax=Sesamum alatum TaxID=300844 RepID=A0AAE1YT55_9LAMI|nr:hypothetical protein Salat_0763700 [Sesamum alatum]
MVQSSSRETWGSTWVRKAQVVSRPGAPGSGVPRAVPRCAPARGWAGTWAPARGEAQLEAVCLELVRPSSGPSELEALPQARWGPGRSPVCLELGCHELVRPSSGPSELKAVPRARWGRGLSLGSASARGTASSW